MRSKPKGFKSKNPCRSVPYLCHNYTFFFFHPPWFWKLLHCFGSRGFKGRCGKTTLPRGSSSLQHSAQKWIFPFPEENLSLVSRWGLFQQDQRAEPQIHPAHVGCWAAAWQPWWISSFPEPESKLTGSTQDPILHSGPWHEQISSLPNGNKSGPSPAKYLNSNDLFPLCTQCYQSSFVYRYYLLVHWFLIA